MTQSIPPSIPSSIDSPVIAVFDFDGTLTHRDSLLPFLQMLTGRWRFTWGLLVLSPMLAGYALKLIPNWRAKERLLTYFLAGISTAQLEYLGQQFAEQVLPNLLRTEAVQRLIWHQQQGHQTLIVSASLEAYLQPLAQQLGIDQVIGTRLESRNGYLTGRMLGKNCYGSEKVARLEALLGPTQQYVIHAYGDSKGDRELLAIAQHPYYRKFLA
ncbi:MAG: HAD-IB family hydrolase [Thainema sp.]